MRQLKQEDIQFILNNLNLISQRVNLICYENNGELQKEINPILSDLKKGLSNIRGLLGFAEKRLNNGA